MMKNKFKTILVVVFLVTVSILFVYWRKGGPRVDTKTKIINPIIGDVAVTVTTTGVVEPQNRLEIKPSIGGRIEKILVKEGDSVKEGQILAWMSSTERAALIDAARSQGEDALHYWEVGVGFGCSIALLLSIVAGWATSISVFSILLATTFSIAVGIGFGLWPARQAAGLNPIEALRYE